MLRGITSSWQEALHVMNHMLPLPRSLASGLLSKDLYHLTTLLLQAKKYDLFASFRQEYLSRDGDKLNKYDARLGCLEMIRASGDVGRAYPEALQIFAEMTLCGLSIDSGIYDILLRACQRNHLWEVSCGLYVDILHSGDVHRPKHFSILATTLSKVGKWELVLHAVSESAKQRMDHHLDDVCLGQILQCTANSHSGWRHALIAVLPWVLKRCQKPMSMDFTKLITSTSHALHSFVDPQKILEFAIEQTTLNMNSQVD